MANGYLMRPIPLTAANFTANCGSTYGIAAAFPAGNLANLQPKVVLQTTAGAGTFRTLIEIDFGVDTSVDTLAVMHTNISAAGIWRVYGANNATGFGAPGTEAAGLQILGFAGWQSFGVAATTKQPRCHAYATGSLASVRWLRVYVEDYAASNPEGLTRIGTVAPGVRLQPAFNYELGGGRRVDDRSTMRGLPGGEKGGFRAAKVPITRVTWGDLSDAELRDLWSLLLDIGESEPVILHEDPDATPGQMERGHYGTLIGLDFWERTQTDKSKIELRLEEWL